MDTSEKDEANANALLIAHNLIVEDESVRKLAEPENQPTPDEHVEQVI